MRRLLLASLLVASMGCGDSADDGGARAAIERGDAELAAGRVDAARAEYERAKSIGATQAWRVRAEAQLVRLRSVELRAKDAAAAIESLTEEMASHPSDAARRQIEQILGESGANEELRALSERRLTEAEGRRIAARAAENAVVEEMIANDQFAAAVLVLRELESRRSTDDVADVSALLDRIAVASTEAAERCLKELPSESAQAVGVLEERLATFAGTPGAARIVAERERLVGIGFSRAKRVEQDSKD